MKSFRVNNVKSFEDSGDIQVRPITVFIGKNSSGKSSLVRFPLVLKQTLLEDYVSPLKLSGNFIDYGDYSDVVFKHEEERNIGFGLTLDFSCLGFPGAVTINVDVKQEDNKLKQLKIADCRFTFQMYDLLVHLEFINDNTMRCKLRNVEAVDYIDLPVTFKSFLPIKTMDVKNLFSEQVNSSEQVNPIENTYYQLMGIAKDICQLYFSRLTYLGPIRTSPMRNFRVSSGIYSTVGDEGQYTTQILVNRHLQNDKDFFIKINHWLQESLNLNLFVKTLDENNFKVIVQDLNTRLESNIVDVGFGVSQLLPIITQGFCNSFFL